MGLFLQLDNYTKTVLFAYLAGGTFGDSENGPRLGKPILLRKDR